MFHSLVKLPIKTSILTMKAQAFHLSSSSGSDPFAYQLPSCGTGCRSYAAMNRWCCLQQLVPLLPLPPESHQSLLLILHIHQVAFHMEQLQKRQDEDVCRNKTINCRTVAAVAAGTLFDKD